eukprot:1187694-Prorocentrum_minimum.AAC.1
MLSHRCTIDPPGGRSSQQLRGDWPPQGSLVFPTPNFKAIHNHKGIKVDSDFDEDVVVGCAVRSFTMGWGTGLGGITHIICA